MMRRVDCPTTINDESVTTMRCSMSQVVCRSTDRPCLQNVVQIDFACKNVDRQIHLACKNVGPHDRSTLLARVSIDRSTLLARMSIPRSTLLASTLRPSLGSEPGLGAHPGRPSKTAKYCSPSLGSEARNAMVNFRLLFVAASQPKAMFQPCASGSTALNTFT